MGTNRRYATHYDRLMDERITERVATTAGPLQSLSREELELDVRPVTKDPQPKHAKVWVRFGGTPLLVDATVTSWTSTAAAVQFVIADNEYRAWVWASAVREGPTSPPHQS